MLLALMHTPISTSTLILTLSISFPTTIAEIIIAKQRNGALGTATLGWKGEFTWFMDLNPTGKEVEK